MKITLDTSSHLFRTFFTLSLFLFSFILFGTAAYSAWTNPPASPPNSNIEAPVNVSATSQIKSGPLQVNGFVNAGSSQINGNLGVGGGPAAPWRIYAPGSSYGIYAESTDGQAIRGYTTTGYAGYFLSGGGGGGLFAQNGSGYYAFLGYPGSSWGVYTNGSSYSGGQVRGDAGFCIGGSCITSWSQAGQAGGISSITSASCSSGGNYGCTATCPSGYYRTGCSADGTGGVYPSGNGCYTVNIYSSAYAYCAR